MDCMILKRALLLAVLWMHGSKGLNIARWAYLAGTSASYNKMAPPYPLTNVQAQIHMETLADFKPQTMDFAVDLYLIETWTDPRLRHNHSSYIMINDRKLIRSFWLPDTYFANSKSAVVNDVTVPNTYLKIWNNGSIRYSLRVSLKLSCHMNLKAYPMDKQMCFIKILTFSDAVKLQWSKAHAVEINSDITEADYVIDRTRLIPSYCDEDYELGINATSNCLQVKIYLDRFLGFSLLRTYIPSITIVLVSWISFWIDPQSVPGRICLCITTLLTQATQAFAAQVHLPPVSYVKAQDVWFAICILLHFAALAEFAVVNMYMLKNEAEYKDMELVKEKDKLLDKIFYEKDESSIPLLNIRRRSSAIRNKDPSGKSRAYMIDLISRFLFPVVFIAMSVTYWWYYLTISA